MAVGLLEGDDVLSEKRGKPELRCLRLEISNECSLPPLPDLGAVPRTYVEWAKRVGLPERLSPK